MLNRRDFFKAGAGLIASTLLPYESAAARQFMPAYSVRDGYEELINSAYLTIQRNSDSDSLILQADELALFCAERGYSRKALEIINDTMKLAQKSSPLKAHCSLMESAKAYTYIDRYEQAHKAICDARQILFDDINEGCYHRATVVHTRYHFYADVIEIARILLKKNNKGMALRLIDDVLKHSSGDGLLFPADNWLLRLLAEAYCDIGQHNKAEEIADKIIAERSVYNGYVSYSDRNKIGALAYIAGSYADIGRRDRAYELLDKISQQSKTKSREMIIAYAKLCEWEKAMDLVEEDIFFMRDRSYIAIAKQAVLFKRYDAAEMALNKAIKAVEGHDNYGVTRIFMLIEIADVFISMGKAEKAVSMVNHAIELFSVDKKDCYFLYKVEILARIAVFYIKSGNIAKGMDTLHGAFEDIAAHEDAFQKSEALIEIAKAYIDNNIAIKEKETKILEKITEV